MVVVTHVMAGSFIPMLFAFFAEYSASHGCLMMSGAVPGCTAQLRKVGATEPEGRVAERQGPCCSFQLQ